MVAISLILFTNAIVFLSLTPDQKICGNTHDQSLNSTDIETKPTS